VPAVAATQHAYGVLRQHDADHHYYLLFIYYYLYISVYVLFCAFSGSMHEASCGSMMPVISFYSLLLFIYYSVSTAAACVRHPAAA
jgi:uncharacterized membrane protein